MDSLGFMDFWPFGLNNQMHPTARRLSVVYSKSLARRRVIRDVLREYGIWGVHGFLVFMMMFGRQLREPFHV